MPVELKVAGRAKRLRGTIRVPGDKSVTHRALLLGAMAAGSTRLHGALRAGVIDAMKDCLAALGVEIESLNEEETLVHGTQWPPPERPLACRNSGTTMRLLMGALAGSTVSATLTGSRRLSQRPMARVAEPLRKMGAQISGLNGSDQPPLDITGCRLRGIEYEMHVASAQVKTALLLAGLSAEGRTQIHEPIASRDHSERLLRHLGVSLTRSDGTLSLEPIQAPLPPFELDIPGDMSAAAFLLAAALLAPGSEITLQNVGLNPTRTGLLEALQRMGAQIETSTFTAADGEPIGDLTAAVSALKAIEIQSQQVVSMIDEVPIFTVIATQAHGETRIRGAGELRLKESDRLAGMTVELRKMGAQIEEHADGLTIEGPTLLSGARVSSHGDHRLAMALTIAGMLASGETIISSAEVIQESYPGFMTTLRSIGADL
ncbi:MAG: 3-phosphoshikimate 1-carboxyvinyltransferase [Anaerolineae bacterium]|nr:MAG: 3-phosphoshikimate 1-carboxyvinyltransferase [Anaerolineae bacterium]